MSVQQLTDCSSDSNYGNDGCQGGNVWYILITFKILLNDLIYFIYRNGKLSIKYNWII